MMYCNADNNASSQATGDAQFPSEINKDCPIQREYRTIYTARTARFSKKSLGSDVGQIKKMSEKLKTKSVLTPRNVREKSNTVIYYKTPTKH